MNITVTNRDEVELAITNSHELDLAIEELKKKKVVQQAELSVLFKQTYESLNPVNMLKKGFAKVIAPGETRDAILKVVGGIGAGLLTKGIIGNRGTGLVGSLFSKVLKAGASTAFYKNADKLKAYGTAIYHSFTKK